MTSSLMTRNDALRVASFNDSAIIVRDEALALSALIGRVSTAEEQVAAVEAQKALRGVLKSIEEARKACKEPILDFGRQIDAIAAAFRKSVEDEEIRVASLVGNFQQAQIAKRLAAEAAARLEQQKIEAARKAELDRIAREEAAERRRLDAEAREAQRKIDEAKNAEEAEKAKALALDLERQKQLAEAQTLQQRDLINSRADEEAKAAKPAVVVPTVKGQRVTDRLVVRSFDVWKVAKHRPDLVDITLRMAEINVLINTGVVIPGIETEREVRSTVTASRPTVVNV